jgi:glucosylceramidase
LYYIMAHFSKYIRPGAIVIDAQNSDSELMVAAAKNPDESIAVVVFNEGISQKNFELTLNRSSINITISPQAIQTITIDNH